MKLQDLATPQQSKQTAKVFESYFGQNINFGRLNRSQTRSMLQKVRGLINEHRRQPNFHYSENNPAYLKLVVMEQGLTARMRESNMNEVALPAGATAENRKIRGRRLREASEVQQAQVVLAAQDMVDKMQKMLEEVTAMQFKDLPALVDSIKNEVGPQQANQFNADATAALTGLVQNLQTGKQQMDTALGVVTGQPAAPAADMGAMPAAADAMDAGADLGAAADELGDLAADIDSEDQTAQGSAADLGRGRR
jgi:hypothetical protein